VTTAVSISNSQNPKNNNVPLLVLPPLYQAVPQHYPFPIIQDTRQSTGVCIGSAGDQFDNIELIDVSTITPSNSVLFESSFDGTADSDGLDTGRIGEEMVYRYLLNEHRNHPTPVTVKWLNQNMESQLPYDIRLTKNGKSYYIEVKSTRTRDQHIFPLSINQIETFLQQRENYFIYRVYIDENKIVILDNIRWRLIQKQQLTCLLQILPMSSD
jgi:hypothetical protein